MKGTRRQRVGGKCTGEQLPGKCWNRASKHFLSAPVKLYMYVRILLCSKFIVEKSGTS
uniref:Uncharacterized protein n=1 Tax=Aegilops tauschii TaxID=37682 RepID=N1R0Y9_AEGTA